MAPISIAFGPRVLQLPFESLADAVSIAGTLILLLLLVAFASTLYRSLQGDGIRWPGDTDEESDGVSRHPPADGDDEDEWKFY